MKVTIYTTPACQFSKTEKDYLASKNIAFEEKNVEADRNALTEMLQVGNNFAGTPVTKIEKDDGTSVVLKGFTQDDFDRELVPAAVAAAPQDTATTPPVEATPSVEPSVEPQVTPPAEPAAAPMPETPPVVDSPVPVAPSSFDASKPQEESVTVAPSPEPIAPVEQVSDAGLSPAPVDNITATPPSSEVASTPVSDASTIQTETTVSAPTPSTEPAVSQPIQDTTAPVEPAVPAVSAPEPTVPPSEDSTKTTESVEKQPEPNQLDAILNNLASKTQATTPSQTSPAIPSA